MSIPSRVELIPGRWVGLPGTAYEVLRHGKIRNAYPVAVEIERTGHPKYPGGWNLDPVQDGCYLRRVR